MRKGWKRQWVGLAALSLVVMFGTMPSASAVAVQGGPVGSGEQGYAIKTYTLDSGTGGNAAGGGKGGITGFGPGTLIIGFKLVATSANANCDLYDTTSLIGKNREAVQPLVIDELAEVSANGTALQIWPNPYRIVTGLSVGVINATCIIYYQ